MKSSLKKHMNTVFGVLVGNAILAFTVAAFIVPHGVIMGGATGIGLTIAHYVPVDLSIIIFIVNSILFVLGAAVLGKKFAVATIASTFIYPTFLSTAFCLCWERLCLAKICGSNNCKYIYLSNVFVYCAEDSGD